MRPGFSPRIVHVGLVVDGVALGPLGLFPVRTDPEALHIDSVIIRGWTMEPLHTDMTSVTAKYNARDLCVMFVTAEGTEQALEDKRQQ